MHRAKSARSGYSDMSRDAEADSNEIELNRLQQRFRLAEGERKQAKQEMELQMRIQMEEVRKLEREQSELNKNYNLAVSKVTKRPFNPPVKHWYYSKTETVIQSIWPRSKPEVTGSTNFLKKLKRRNR